MKLLNSAFILSLSSVELLDKSKCLPVALIRYACRSILSPCEVVIRLSILLVSAAVTKTRQFTSDVTETLGAPGNLLRWGPYVGTSFWSGALSS